MTAPGAIEDTVAAPTWLSRNATSLGLDSERIAIAGDSAGAGLAAVALQETGGQLPVPVRAQALLYPALDLRGRLPSRTEHADQFPLPREMVAYFYERYFGSAWPFADPRAMPLLYDNYAGLPPALVITAGHDPLRDEAVEFPTVLEILIHNYVVAPCRLDFAGVDRSASQRLNNAVIVLSLSGDTHRFLAAPILGSAIATDYLDRVAASILLVEHEQADDASTVSAIFDRLDKAGTD